MELNLSGLDLVLPQDKTKPVELDLSGLDRILSETSQPTSKIVFQPENAEWSIGRLSSIEDFFIKKFSKPLPVRNVGQGKIHNKWNYDHRAGVDIGINPNSKEGKELVTYLKENNIPFLAFDSAVPGVSTGPHIHVGRPSAGAGSFLQSYMQGKLMKEKEKLQQNQILIDALTQQLADETIPYRQRAKILDELPKLVGIKKMDKRLSQMLGLDEEFLNQEVESKPAIQSQEGTSDGYFADPDVTDPNMASAIKIRGTEATSSVPAELVRRGDLSPLQIKKKLALEMKKADDEGDVEKHKRIAQINFELQEQSYKANGYKITSEGTNAQGEYVQILTNNSGDIKINKMPEGFKPLKLQIAERNVSKPSVFVRDREDYWESQGYSPEEANRKALEDANEQFKLKLKTGEAYVKGQEQRTTGTVPIQPSQKVDDSIKLAERRATLRANISSIKRQAADASSDASNKTAQATAQWNNVVEPIKREMDKLLSDGYETTSPEYRGLQTKLNTEIDRFNELKRFADDAVSRDNSLKNSVKESEDVLNNFEAEIGVAGSSGIPDFIKKAIEIIRKNNQNINDPNSPTYMTDAAIIEYLKKQRRIK